MGRARTLVVSWDESVVARWSAWLERAGHAVMTCPGPRGDWECPRLGGLRCARRETADVAIVHVGAPRPYEQSTGTLELSCTKLPDDSRTVFVHERGVRATLRGGADHIPPPSSPGALLAAVRRVLG